MAEMGDATGNVVPEALDKLRHGNAKELLEDILMEGSRDVGRGG